MTNFINLPYFAPLLPWQTQIWQQLQHEKSLPHAILASGMSGIGKREFVWRWVAQQLCHRQDQQGACGSCDSCQWLISGTHPDLHILPASSSPTAHLNQEHIPPKKTDSKKTSQISNNIKIDDIRNIQNFVHQSSQGVRICVFDYAETMTIAAANALLKTLEEPRQGVQLILISDKPTLLLPTIKSRVQRLPLTPIDHNLAYEYLENQINQPALNHTKISSVDTAQISSRIDIQQLLALSDYAPLQAISTAQSDWYSLRKDWMYTWLALKNKTRSPISASDHWQSKLNLKDFIRLTQVMLIDLQRLASGLPTHQKDIDFNMINNTIMPTISALYGVQMILQEIDISCKQNVQDKFAYDMLMQSLSDQ